MMDASSDISQRLYARNRLMDSTELKAVARPGGLFIKLAGLKAYRGSREVLLEGHRANRKSRTALLPSGIAMVVRA